MESELQKIFSEARAAIAEAQTSKTLYEAKTLYMGKKGRLSLALKEALKGLKSLPAAERPRLGSAINKIRGDFERLHLQRREALSQKEMLARIAGESLDLSLPGPKNPLGSLHPAKAVIRRIAEIFRPLGWTVRSGPFVETDWHNFEALNIPPFHPSRDLQDTFYVDGGRALRTHTSPVQIRVMESEKPPLAVLAPGAVFRCDSDISHSPMFHQVEGLFVDKKASFADLKGTLSFFLREMFGFKAKTRFRPSFFPFTEPSAEYDVSCPFCKGAGCAFCKQSGWIEIGGCGLVHPKVFEAVRLNPPQAPAKSPWQGFAFGLGVERLAIILYGIPDIRMFFENDVRFLRQFSNV